MSCWWPCCTSTGSGIVVTEAIGAGHIVAVADGNIYHEEASSTELSTCVLDGLNALFWSNVHQLAGGGTIACAGSADYWHQSAFEPTTDNVTAIGDLSGAAAMLEGVCHDLTNPFTPTRCEVTTITAAEYLPWLEAGGVLVLVMDYICPDDAGTVSEASLEAATRFNALLIALGSTIRFVGACNDCGCDPADDVEPQMEGQNWPACRNFSHPLIDGTVGAPLPYIGYACTSSVTGGEWVAKRADPDCPAFCDPVIDDGDYGVLILEGTVGGYAFRSCMSYTEDPDEGRFWEGDSGTTWESPDCPGTTLEFRLQCQQIGPDEFGWRLEVTASDGVTDTTAEVPVDVTSGSPLAGSVADTLTGICGDAAIAATLSACATPIGYPCCDGDLTNAEKCCLTVPDLYLYQTGLSCMGNPLTVSGTLIWDGSEWSGDVTWDVCGGDAVYAVTVSCGYTLTHDGIEYDSTSDQCPIPGSGLTFPDVMGPVFSGCCDGGPFDLVFYTEPPEGSGMSLLSTPEDPAPRTPSRPRLSRIVPRTERKLDRPKRGCGCRGKRKGDGP